MRYCFAGSLSQSQEQHAQKCSHCMKSKPGDLTYESYTVIVSGNCRDNRNDSNEADEQEKVTQYFV